MGWRIASGTSFYYCRLEHRFTVVLLYSTQMIIFYLWSSEYCKNICIIYQMNIYVITVATKYRTKKKHTWGLRHICVLSLSLVKIMVGWYGRPLAAWQQQLVVLVLVIAMNLVNKSYEFFEKEIILSAWVTAIFFIDWLIDWLIDSLFLPREHISQKSKNL